MLYLAIIGSNGPQPDEHREQMAREFPAYQEEMEPRGVKLLGRPLDIDVESVTVKVRGDETLVADGPFAETKEFVGGIDLLNCSDLDEAIEVEGKNPVVKFLPFEIRPFSGDARQGKGMQSFADGEDAAGTPYLLTAWADGDSSGAAANGEYTSWQDDLDSSGRYVFGGEVRGPETATTLRFRDGDVRLSDGPFVDVDGFITCVDVVSCAGRAEAVASAAAHPLAQTCTIEVRPFHSWTHLAQGAPSA